MTTTVVALYEDLATAQRAAQDLVDSGFDRQKISIAAADSSGQYQHYIGNQQQPAGQTTSEHIATDAGIGALVGSIGGLMVGLGALLIPGVGPIIAAGPILTALTSVGVGAGVGAVAGGLVGALVNMGVPEEEAGYYAEGVRRGGALMTVQTSDEWVDRVRATMERYQPVDIEEQASQWRQQGWNGFDPNAAPYTASSTSPAAATPRESRQPEDYDLYEARFRQHYQNNYPHSNYTYDNYAAAYRYGLELANYNYYHLRRSWAEVEPEAHRAWEEKNPGTWPYFKDAVHYGWDEVTSTLGFDQNRDDFNTFSPDFRRHYNENYAHSGYPFERYDQAYRYGYALRHDPRYTGRTWAELEPEARRTWETQYEGPWDQFKDAVRYAWEQVKSTVGVR